MKDMVLLPQVMFIILQGSPGPCPFCNEQASDSHVNKVSYRYCTKGYLESLIVERLWDAALDTMVPLRTPLMIM